MLEYNTNEREQSNRIVLITGSTRGIGLATAAEFLRNSDSVAIFCRHRHHVREASGLLLANSNASDSNLISLVGDVRFIADAHDIVQSTIDRFGRIDILVNNAGVAVWKPIEQTSDVEWDYVVDTNLKGCFNFIQAVIPIMKQQQSGIIINISSGLGVSGQANYSAYSASKFGVIGLTQVVAAETDDIPGIKSYAVLPGAVATALHMDIHPWEDSSRMMTPEYIAARIFEVAHGRERSGSSIEVYG